MDKKAQLALKARKMMNVGTYKEGGIKSFGGTVGPVGGTIGMDNGKPFGSMNIKGKQIGSFGPQGNDAKPKKKGKEVNPFMKA